MTEPTMETRLKDPLADGLIHQDHLVIRWQPLDKLPVTEQLIHTNESNEWFLRASAALTELAPDLSDDHSELAPDIARLELKMNLLLELVGHTLSRQLSLPAPVPVKLTGRGLEWQSDDLPEINTLISLSVYLQPDLPRPVQFYGTVLQNEGGKAVVAFHGNSQTTQDWLDKFIFRHHRRSVAHSRSVIE